LNLHEHFPFDQFHGASFDLIGGNGSANPHAAASNDLSRTMNKIGLSTSAFLWFCKYADENCFWGLFIEKLRNRRKAQSIFFMVEPPTPTGSLSHSMESLLQPLLIKIELFVKVFVKKNLLLTLRNRLCFFL